MRALRQQAGMSLIEVMMVSSLLVIVLGAALAPFDVLSKTQQKSVEQNEAQDDARSSLSLITRNLRNTSGQNQLVNLASPYDLVVETVDYKAKPSGSLNARNLMRVRYCLDTTSPGSSLVRGRLWEQQHRWTTSSVPTSMPTPSCPDMSWGSARVVADYVTNKATNARRPTAAALFSYYPNASSLNTITSIRVKLLSDRRWDRDPPETELQTGVLLRNQNGLPTASFNATPGQVGTRKIILNANTSTDPEGLPLTYRWCDVTSQSVCDETTAVGSGVLYTYTAPVTGTRQMKLQVFDVGGLQSTAGPLAVAAP